MRGLKVFITFSLLLCIAADPLPHRQGLSDHGIIGGKNAVLGQFPYQLNLQKKKTHTCGAVLIANDIALTAAHCTFKVPVFSLSVIAARLDQYDETEGIRIRVDRAIEHPKYTGNDNLFDISILFLKKPYRFGPHIQAIALPKANEVVPEGAIATVSGWGKDKLDGEYTVDLKYVNIPIWNGAVCNKELLNFKSPVLCGGTRKGGENSCAGDSGGPLVYKNKLIGLVSFGFGCGKPNKPAVYTDVAAYRKWIHEKTNI